MGISHSWLVLMSFLKGLSLVAGLFFIGSFSGWTANTNPTILFQASRTNITNLVGRPFSLFLYTLFANINPAGTANQRASSSAARWSRARFNTVAGTTYFLAVDGVGRKGGAYVLTLLR